VVSEQGTGAGALQGYRVLDLSEPWGAYCGKLLADLGADVVKVEPPAGDPARALGPFKDDRPHPEASLTFAYYHTNQRSVVLDLADDDGRALLARLLGAADVLLETFPPERAAALGLDYATLHARHPRLVVASLSGFGSTGPDAGQRATSLVVFARSGLMDAIGAAEGPPVAAPGQMVFDLAAVDAAIGTLGALYARGRTGRSQHVEVAALEVLAAQAYPRLPGQHFAGRTGRLNSQLAPSGTYECQDGAVELNVVMPGQWEGLKDLLGRPPELERPEWAQREGRGPDLMRIAPIVAAGLRDRPRAEIVAEAQQRRVPCLPVNTLADFVAETHVAARQFFVPASHPVLGPHPLPGAPYRLSEGGWALRRHAPALGEHTAAVLADWLEGPGAVPATGQAASAAAMPGGEAMRPHPAPRDAAGVAPVPGREGSAGANGAGALPLAGVRVLSFSTAFAGPVASRYLADLGAEVIKVESRKRPDNTRGFGGPFVERSGVSIQPGFVHFNRNKRDVAIDLGQERGRELIRRLVAISDVVTENFSLRVMKGWGLDYTGLRAIRPDIILLDMQGMGQTGPLREYITYGNLLHSYAGLTRTWGYSHGSWVDYVAAEHAAFAVLAALLYRARTGRGVHVDLGQVETAAALLGTAYLDYAINGHTARPGEQRGQPNAPSGCYRCAGDDAWCVIDVTSDDEWARLVEVLGRPAWTAEPRFASRGGRLEHAAALDARLAEWTAAREPRAIEAQLQAAGVPAAAVRAAREVPEDPHLRAREFYTTIDQPVLGAFDYAEPPIHLSETPLRIRNHAPVLGEANAYVFGELLGLPADEIARLTEEGVLS
jgi:crotonobetainyl-CoA:carnitine CoA-transferase CaiB-like acyl-CoA transferase